MSGTAALAWSLWEDARWAVLTCLSTLTPALILFIAPVAWALRARRASPAAAGLLLALAGLLTAGVLGLWMLHGHGGMRFPGPRGLWIQVHLTVALLGWVGGVQEVLVLRFARARRDALERHARLRLGLLATGLALPVLVLTLAWMGIIEAGGESTGRLAALGALPAACSVWLLLPLQRLRNPVRRAADGGDRLLDSSLALAPLTAVAAATTLHGEGHPWNLLLGWLAIWGWAGTLAHGALLRALATTAARGRPAFALHLGSLVAGVAAISTGSAGAASATGLMLIATALWLLRCLAPSLRLRTG